MSEQDTKPVDNSNGSSDAPCSTGSCDSRHKDNTKNAADKNKLANATANTKSHKETAVMHLRGYPQLKAKITINVAGVGAGSGKWYVKEAIQEWFIDKGYYSQGMLIRGRGSNGKPPGSGNDKPVDKPPTDTPGEKK